MISIEWKYYCAQRTTRAARSSTFTSEICVVPPPTLDQAPRCRRRIQWICATETNYRAGIMTVRLLEEAEDRRDVVLRQKEIEKNQLIQKDMYFARKMSKSVRWGAPAKGCYSMRQIIHRQVKEENHKKLYEAKVQSETGPEIQDRLVTAKFARSAIAMTRHVNKGIHAKLGLDRRHANVRKVAKIKTSDKWRPWWLQSYKERYTKLRDRIDVDKQGEYTPTDPPCIPPWRYGSPKKAQSNKILYLTVIDQRRKLAWRQEKELRRLELKAWNESCKMILRC